MSIQKIIQEAINKNPHDLKEALEEELRDRIRLALEAKMSDEEDDDSSEEDDDSSEEDDEEDDDEEDMKKESVEQIDELDRKTLASYVKKASADAAMKSGKAEYEAGRAHDATYGGESPDHGAASRWRARSDKSSKTASNRLKGVSRATDRLAKESVDQIDEISASTLGSYIRKGTKDIEKSYDAREKARDVEDSKTARAMGLRARKREKGVSDAISKLTGHYTAKVHAGDK